MKEKRNLFTYEDLPKLIDAVTSVGYPCHVIIWSGAKRSIEQNRLDRLWMKEAAEQLKEYTAEEYRAYCKLHFGVVVLLEDHDFKDAYRKQMRPLDYETKLAMMSPPLNFPVTSIMTVKQMSRYLEKVHDFFISLGVNLTQPIDKRFGPTPEAPEGAK